MTSSPRPLSSPVLLRQAAVEELGALGAMLDDIRPGQSVHGTRRRIKRIRSLLRLIRAPLGEESFRRLNAALREAAGSLAGPRRAEALVIVARHLEPKSARPAYWRPLAEAYSRTHDADAGPANGLVKARTTIAAVMQDLAQVRLADADEGAVAVALITTYGKARKRLRQALASDDAGELHEARKFLIHHLHHRAILALGGKKQLARLEALRQALGDLNDLDELAHISKTGSSPPPERALARLAKARSRLLAVVADEARRLFRQRPKAYGKRLGASPGA
jgi:hypothetical protein